MSAIRVLGIGPTDAVREALDSLGFTRLVSAPDGFVAYRDGGCWSVIGDDGSPPGSFSVRLRSSRRCVSE
jgi:hypothetical protein